MKNWQTYNYADLETMLAKHRREAFVSCDKKCFCWEIERFLYQQEITQQSAQADDPSLRPCEHGYNNFEYCPHEGCIRHHQP